jgi:two-component system phosphate regulon sensor histidine kinase PhoR
MGITFKKSYKFAAKSAFYITVFTTFFVALLLQIFFEINPIFLVFFALGTAAFSFFVMQYRTEQFIYRRIKKIYDDVSFLESSTLRSKSITTDMATLTREVQKFATDKKMEIETLKIREEYRREFLGNVSHELKTPLFTVQGYISTLAEGAIKDKSVRKKYLDRAEKGVERLIHIVQDLDMITKLEVGNLNLTITPFDIVEVVQSVFDLLEMEASKKDILLHFDRRYIRPIFVLGDTERIRQVLINLVVNSIKYGKDKGSTEVSIEESDSGKVVVCIKDDGQGIETQHIPRLFERFFRVDKSGSRQEGGSGLGLAIVKHIVEAHGEQVLVESQIGEGSAFSFTLKKSEEVLP